MTTWTELLISIGILCGFFALATYLENKESK